MLQCKIQVQWNPEQRTLYNEVFCPLYRGCHVLFSEVKNVLEL
jgi:hypothetical protein